MYIVRDMEYTRLSVVRCLYFFAGSYETECDRVIGWLTRSNAPGWLSSEMSTIWEVRVQVVLYYCGEVVRGWAGEIYPNCSNVSQCFECITFIFMLADHLCEHTERSKGKAIVQLTRPLKLKYVYCRTSK